MFSGGRSRPKRTLLTLALLCLSHLLLTAHATSRNLLQEEYDDLHLPAETKALEMDHMKGWISDSPHPPGQDLADALAAAAWVPPNSTTRGIVILNSGSKFAFDELLPRWLDSMTHTLDGDISKHTLILTLGTKAHELCQGEQAHAYHQCVLLPHWLGPDRMLHFGDEWYTVVTLSKLELMLNVLTLGYIPIWMDTDMVHIRNPLPYLAALDADVAVTGEHCFSTLTDPALIFELNTGIMKLAPNAPTVRWMADWVEIQKEKMLDLLERGWETMQPLHRPHDQVTFHKFMLPQLKENATYKPLLKLALLTQQEFPNFCGGWCGCEGTHRRGASRLISHNNKHGHLMTGRVECPLDVWKNWYSYHVPCVHSFHEKVALIDVYQSAQNLLVAPSRVARFGAGRNGNLTIAAI